MSSVYKRGNIEALASHIIARSQKTGNPVTNLHLQKVLYFTLSEAKEKQLISEEVLRDWYDLPFLMWRYGPVVEIIHVRYSIFGASGIFVPETPDSRFEILNDVIDTLLDVRALDLVRRTTSQLFYQEQEHLIVNGKSSIPYSFEDLKS